MLNNGTIERETKRMKKRRERSEKRVKDLTLDRHILDMARVICCIDNCLFKIGVNK